MPRPASHYVILAVFFATFGIAVVSCLVDAVGRRDIAERYLGPTFLILWGVCFSGGMLYVIYNNTPIDMIYFGEVSRDRKPLAWYIPIFVIFAIGVFVLLLGLVLLITGGF